VFRRNAEISKSDEIANPDPDAAEERCAQTRTVLRVTSGVNAEHPLLASALALALIAQAPPTPSEWRLVRTPNPRGGPDAISIMRTADLARSDSNLAGLTLRCAQSGVEILIILLEPLPLRARPQVTTSAAGSETTFEATVVPPGIAILLSADAWALLQGPWQAPLEVQSLVSHGESRAAGFAALCRAHKQHEQASVHGAIPITGLSAALEALRANCPLP
jgi:hypothetical protein